MQDPRGADEAWKILLGFIQTGPEDERVCQEMLEGLLG